MFSILKKFFAVPEVRVKSEPHTVFVFYVGKVKRATLCAAIQKHSFVSRFIYVAQDSRTDIDVQNVAPVDLKL